MANYYAHCRSNYFLVKDVSAFETWVRLFNGALVYWQREDSFVAIAGADDCAWPQFRYPLPPKLFKPPQQASSASALSPSTPPAPVNDVDEVESEPSELEECNFINELAGHLAPGHVAVLKEIGNEKLRYLIGQAIAVNASGKCVTLDLDEIYKRAERLGPNVTRASY